MCLSGEDGSDASAVDLMATLRAHPESFRISYLGSANMGKYFLKLKSLISFFEKMKLGDLT